MNDDIANVRETIVGCLREEKPSFADRFQDSTLCSEIEIDSIDIIQIVFRLEDIFKISIDIDPSSRFETIGQLLDFLQNMVVQSRRNDATAT